MTNKIEAADLQAALAEILLPKKKSSKAAKPKYVIIVDGKVSSQMATKKSEVKEAAMSLTMHALANGNSAPVITFAEVQNEIKVNVPVEGI